jgi:hypothetical protein
VDALSGAWSLGRKWDAVAGIKLQELYYERAFAHNKVPAVEKGEVMAKKPYVIDLDLDELEYIHNALASWMEDQSELAQADNGREMENAQGDTVVVDLSDMFVAQYIDAKALRKRFVDLVGRDLTESGQ